MSFFISDSLKDVISEDDLMPTSKNNKLKIKFKTSNEKIHAYQIKKIVFNNRYDKLDIKSDKENLKNILHMNNEDIFYSLSLNDDDYIHTKGILKINCLEINNEDNYITCQIVIDKQG